MARAAGQIAGVGDLLVPVSYELALEERFDHAPWRVNTVEVVEELSGEYSATVSLENDNPATEERELRGSSASLLLIRAGQGERRFSGIVQTVVSEGITSNGTRRCRIVLVPAFQCLAETIDWQKFVNMTVPDILRAELREGLAPFGRDVAFDLTREGGTSTDPFAIREYTAQRGESTYQFVRRLCSEEGLALWYDNSGPVEKLTITDDNSHFPNLAGPVRLAPVLGIANAQTTEAVRRFELASNRMPTVATVNRFDLTRPMVPLLERTELAPRPNGAGPAGSGEVYDPTSVITLHQYQEERYTGQDARFQARLRLQTAQVGGEVGNGEGDVIAFRPGVIFQLTTGAGHPSPLEGQHLITQVRHTGRSPMRGDAGTAMPSTYANSFTTIPASVPFRAPRIARPIAVFDYAVVASASDDDSIHHDIHGRVKVKFWWDRTPGEPSDSDSSWIPVAVPWAGQGRGLQAVPRRGDVVVVSYDLGDPDRPVVTGSVNTGTNRLVYPNDSSTLVAFRTQSQRPDGQGGLNTPNYNEMSMDDAAGGEVFRVYAGRNYQRTVLNDENTSIANNEYRNVGCNRSATVCGDEDVDIYGSRSVSVGGSDSLSVGGSESISISGSESINVDGNESVYIGGNESVNICGSDTVKVTGPRTTTVVGPETVILTDRNTKISGSDNTHVSVISKLTADVSLVLQQDGSTVNMMGGYIDATAASWLQLSRGGAYLLLDGSDQVTINAGNVITINANGNPVNVTGAKISLTGDSEVSMQVGGNFVKVDASGVTIKGANIAGSADSLCSLNGGVIKLNG
jgi:type VI secretion system secreted protein VgrG